MVERQDHDKNQLNVLTMGKTDWVLPKDRISHIMCRNDMLERQCCGSMFSRLDSLVLVLSLVEADALGNHTPPTYFWAGPHCQLLSFWGFQRSRLKILRNWVAME